VDRLLLTTVPEGMIAWTTGKRADLPGGADEITIREFTLDR
jgi:hypothetical protein